MTILDFSGREQLYYQLYDRLFQAIMNGTYPIGNCIPSESELMKTFEVSRATARKAMEMLVTDGLVRKQRGHGTVVISSHPNYSPQRVTKYSRKARERNIIARKKTISFGTMIVSDEIAKILELEKGTEIICLKRVRYGDKNPYYLEINYFEKKYVPELLAHDFSEESLRVYLDKTYHIQWSYAQQQIYSVTAGEDLAALLSVEESHPLLKIKRISFDVDNVPREYVETYYLADKYHLEIELTI